MCQGFQDWLLVWYVIPLLDLTGIPSRCRCYSEYQAVQT